MKNLLELFFVKFFIVWRYRKYFEHIQLVIRCNKMSAACYKTNRLTLESTVGSQFYMFFFFYV